MGEAARRVAEDPAVLGALVDEIVIRDVELEALIEHLARGSGSARHGAGVSARTLQRRLVAHGLPPPDFWRLLGRARRAAGCLRSGQKLADIADAHGYSDQAHMTRDFTRWFGAPPARMARDTALLDVTLQPGLGNWTGEQISTR